jgi:uncharacterized membrane protein
MEYFDRRFKWLTVAVIAVYIMVFCVFTLGRYDRYNATGFDLAFYDQILWRTAHTDVMGVSIEGNNVSNWAFHVEPILLILAPLTAIFSDTRWLLIWQTLALAVAAIAAYRIAERTWRRSWVGFLFATLYLLYPVVGWANKFDFHPLTLTTPLLFFAFDAAERRQFKQCSILLLLALLCKEELGLVVAVFGLYFYFSDLKWRGGLLWTLFGSVYAVLGFFVIIPAAQGKVVQDLQLANQAYLRYRWLFTGTLQDKIAYMTGPDTPVKLRFLAQLLVPLLATPLRAWKILAIAAPVFGLSLLSANLNQSGLFHQYMADAVPFIMIAAIKGSYALQKEIRTYLRLHPTTAPRLILFGMLAGTITMFVLYNPFTYVPTEPYAPIYGWEPGASLSGLRAAEAIIPADSCLTASNNIAAHYGQRQFIYVFGIGNWTQCDLSVVDLADSRFVSFGVPQAMACDQFLNDHFAPIFYQDEVVVLRRNAPSTPEFDTRFRTFCANLVKPVVKQP